MSGLIPKPETVNEERLLPDSKLADIFQKLDLMKPGEIRVISNADDIPYIKQYIDCYKTVDFNSTYTKLRKLQTPI